MEVWNPGKTPEVLRLRARSIVLEPGKPVRIASEQLIDELDKLELGKQATERVPDSMQVEQELPALFRLAKHNFTGLELRIVQGQQI